MRLEEGYDEIERFRQLLMDKDREIEKINGELQQIEVFKTQVGFTIKVHDIMNEYNETSRLMDNAYSE